MKAIRRLLVCSLTVSLVLIPFLTARARFIRADLVQIPVARLVANLETMVKQKPKDANLRFNLARVHAMAFALKTDNAKVWRGKERRGAWFGYTPKSVPFKAKKAKTAAEKQQAQQHLRQALKRYDEVLKIKKNHLPAQLGRAWLTEQSGKKKEAVKQYRKIVHKAWAKEGMRKSGPLGGNYITAEAAGYLIPLLDKQKDAAEIQALRQKIAHLKKLPRPITPIVVPLRAGASIRDLVDRHARVRFDADGSGINKTWTWITPDAAWLVHDKSGRGRISSALQMFGNVSFWLHWENGYQALAVLDDDRDGYLSGRELDGLALWRDVNSDGVSEASEVKSLSAWGIVKLSCRYQTETETTDRVAVSPLGVHFRDGSARPTYDVILHRIKQ